jgi:hypothetical protein
MVLSAPAGFPSNFDGFSVFEGFVLIVLNAFAISLVYIWKRRKDR